MSKSASTGDWVPLMEYATKNRVSLSTLRRYIKASKIQYRVENGRYLVWDDSSQPSTPADFRCLELALFKAHEEIAELKTLIALYEERMSHPRLES